MEDGTSTYGHGVQYQQRNSSPSSNHYHHHHHPHDDDLHALISRIPPLPPHHPSSSSYASSTTDTYSIKARIAAHPRYLRLLDAYIDCQKVGAPPEIVSLLDGIRREHGASNRAPISGHHHLAADPELDLFMEAYCDVLTKYKADLARPFDEATSFFSDMELQLSDLCKTAPSIGSSDNTQGGCDVELSGGEIYCKDNDRDIKEKLLRKYSGYLSSLKQEFSKKKKKGKLPKESRQTLLAWWNVHYNWPYPTEADKITLAELTGLDQKQINNWFINQRKRHWKPSETMQYAVMGTLSGPYYG